LKEKNYNGEKNDNIKIRFNIKMITEKTDDIKMITEKNDNRKMRTGKKDKNGNGNGK